MTSSQRKRQPVIIEASKAWRKWCNEEMKKQPGIIDDGMLSADLNSVSAVMKRICDIEANEEKLKRISWSSEEVA